VRKSTKTAFTLVGFGAMGVSYAIGANAQLPQSFGASSTVTTGSLAPSNNSQTGASSSANPSTSSSAVPSTSSSASTSSGSGSSNAGSSGAVPKPSKSASSAPAASASASTPAVQPSATPTKTAAAATTKTGAAIQYRYGTVQLSVTLTNGSITAINLVKATATDGRSRAFPTLVSAAISANGIGFGNIGGATFTTDAFKQALTSALGN